MVLSGVSQQGSSPLTRGKPGASPKSPLRRRLIPAHAGKTFSTMTCGTASRAHPRSRGENLMVPLLLEEKPGSSPLTRGKQRWAHPLASSGGLIPAHAGKTLRALARVKRLRAHPHSREENCWASGEVSSTVGSSPLTRGKPCACVHARTSIGLIPAHAGIRQPARPFSGSSPLTRGKPRSNAPVRQGRRLIPTHARKTVTTRQLASPTRAHPHSRGENDCSKSVAALTAGSSPLTLGKQNAAGRVGRNGRLIPAHAGKTMTVPPVAIHRRAHPHSHGENAAAAAGYVVKSGSSPLTRGKHHPKQQRYRHRRRIPAHAGKTPGPRSSRTAYQAHPRSRRENDDAGLSPGVVAGSSPLTRGKHCLAFLCLRSFGLIPAHAGKTTP